MRASIFSSFGEAGKKSEIRCCHPQTPPLKHAAKSNRTTSRNYPIFMSDKTIEEKVKDIIVEQLGVNPEQVTRRLRSSRISARIRSIPSSW